MRNVALGVTEAHQPQAIPSRSENMATLKEIIQAIEPRHVLKALAHIDKRGVPPHRESTEYDLMHEGVDYPPKYVLALASKYATGYELHPGDHNGGKQTNDPLKRLGFEIRGNGARAESVGNKGLGTEIDEEGKEAYTTSKMRRRSSRLVREGREYYSALEPDGKLRCHACGFAKPASIDHEIVQLHHKKPIREGERTINLSGDNIESYVVPLCPTCHVMAHDTDTPRTVSELKKLRKGS